MFLSPNFVLGPDVLPVPSGLAGRFICHLFYSERVMFFCNKFSICLVTILAIERWYVVARPHLYKGIFSPKNVLVFIGSAVLVSLLVVVFDHFIKRVGDCELRPVMEFSKRTLKLKVILQILLTGLFPFLLVFLSYIHINRTIKVQTAVLGNRGRFFGSPMQARLLRMVKISSCALGVCVLPHQIYHLFALFRLIRFGSTFHRVLFVLAMANSVVNPFIYYAANPTYRQGLKDFLRWRKHTANAIGFATARSS